MVSARRATSSGIAAAFAAAGIAQPNRRSYRGFGSGWSWWSWVVVVVVVVSGGVTLRASGGAPGAIAAERQAQGETQGKAQGKADCIGQEIKG
jgi:uncharacterized membrane protein